MSTVQLLSLVEYIAYKVGCAYISDLPRLDALGRIKAAHALESVPVETYPLGQWNDALQYCPGTGGSYRCRTPRRPDGQTVRPPKRISRSAEYNRFSKSNRKRAKDDSLPCSIATINGRSRKAFT